MSQTTPDSHYDIYLKTTFSLTGQPEQQRIDVSVSSYLPLEKGREQERQRKSSEIYLSELKEFSNSTLTLSACH